MKYVNTCISFYNGAGKWFTHVLKYVLAERWHVCAEKCGPLEGIYVVYMKMYVFSFMLHRIIQSCAMNRLLFNAELLSL
jgi:hypothetical protein